VAAPDIKILISCHKPIALPHSDVFYPMHVGAAGADSPLAGTHPDNVGDNLSDRNFTYCELTAQYWAWKNLDADYYCMCHYRRFFYFGSKRHVTNDHGQIEVDRLSQQTIEEYFIDDTALIESTVARQDMITPLYWDVRNVPTPDGPKKTIREHMRAYGLIDDAGFELLLEIAQRVQPEYYDDIVAYLNGSRYLGYNCYIMRRELFERLCEFEFSILEEFDRRFDYSQRTATQRRICGFLGEILFSTFANHVRAEGAWRTAELPMVFFMDTPAPLDLHRCNAEPITSSDDNCQLVDIVWRYPLESPYQLVAGIDSLIRSLDAQKQYRLTVLCEPEFECGIAVGLLGGRPSCLDLRFTSWDGFDKSALPIEMTWPEAEALLPWLIPWLFPDSKHFLWMQGSEVFFANPANVFESLGDRALACMHDLSLERALNLQENDAVKACYQAQTGQCFDLYDGSLMVIDGMLLRSQASAENVLQLFRELCVAFDARPKDLVRFLEPSVVLKAALSALSERLGAGTIPFADACPALEVAEVNTWAAVEHASPWRNALASGPGLLHYTQGKELTKRELSPFSEKMPEADRIFWMAARQSAAYEQLLLEMAEHNKDSIGDTLINVAEDLLPCGTRRRAVASKVKVKATSLLGR